MLVFTKFTTKNDGNMKLLEDQESFLIDHKLQHKKPITMKQKHTNILSVVDEKYSPSTISDALVTNRNDVALFVRVADCQPILMYDEDLKVIAAVHAGREGVYQNIIKQTLSVFRENFGSSVKKIKVVIGPSAKKCCYEVGRDSNEHLEFVLSNFGPSYIKGKNIDLNGITKMQLLKEGVLEKNIQISDECTICNNEKYFSYRCGAKKEQIAGVISLV